MIDIRPRDSLAHRNHGWLDTRYHFSFSDYHDPARMGWGALRVWNDDSIAAQSGFPPHSHSDMEIVTFVHSGAISHKDSLGNSGRTVAGDVQVMSAGTGITHAEFNLEDDSNHAVPTVDHARPRRREAELGNARISARRPLGGVDRARQRHPGCRRCA